MKIFISLIALFNVLLSCSCSSRISYENYENKKYKITLKQKSNIIVGFIISNKETNSKLAFTPSLIMIDGEIPEGSLRSDYNSTDETELYQCDSSCSRFCLYLLQQSISTTPAILFSYCSYVPTLIIEKISL